jgi:hypothetical protein
MGSGVDFHPEARVDIDEIAEFIALLACVNDYLIAYASDHW